MAQESRRTMKLQAPPPVSRKPLPRIGPALGLARHQHHGILQGVQRQKTRRHGAGRPVPDVKSHLFIRTKYRHAWISRRRRRPISSRMVPSQA